MYAINLCIDYVCYMFARMYYTGARTFVLLLYSNVCSLHAAKRSDVIYNVTLIMCVTLMHNGHVHIQLYIYIQNFMI